MPVAVLPEHWTLNPDTGGGRILGETCHFLDLVRHLAGSPTVALRAVKLDGQTAAIAVTYADGSIVLRHRRHRARGPARIADV